MSFITIYLDREDDVVEFQDLLDILKENKIDYKNHNEFFIEFGNEEDKECFMKTKNSIFLLEETELFEKIYYCDSLSRYGSLDKVVISKYS